MEGHHFSRLLYFVELLLGSFGLVSEVGGHFVEGSKLVLALKLLELHLHLDFFQRIPLPNQMHYSQHFHRFFSQLKHFEVLLYLYLRLLPELHLVLCPFSESRVLIGIVEVCLLPEDPEEGPLPFLLFVFPIL